MLRNSVRAASRALKRVSGAGGAACASGRSTFSTLSSNATNPASSKTAFFVLASAVAAPSLAFAASSAAKERSFIMVKPDGVNRGLVSEVIGRFEKKGYKLVGAKVTVPSKDLASTHYAEHEGRPFFPKLVDFLSSGAVVALVFEGKGVISYGRTLIGATNPLASAPGTLRGDYGLDVGRNIIHGSDSLESAQREISLWFSADELAEYDRVIDSWIYE